MRKMERRKAEGGRKRTEGRTDGCKGGAVRRSRRREMDGRKGELPGGEGEAGEVGIVVTPVTGDFGAEPRGAVEGLVRGAEFDLGDDEPGIGPVKLVHFPSMDSVSIVDEMPGLVDDDGLGEGKEFLRLAGRDLLFPFETRKTAVEGGSLDGQETLVVTDTDPDGTTGSPTDISLRYAVGAEDFRLEVPDDEKLAFDFLGHGEICFQQHKYKRFFA